MDQEEDRQTALRRQIAAQQARIAAPSGHDAAAHRQLAALLLELGKLTLEPAAFEAAAGAYGAALTGLPAGSDAWIGTQLERADCLVLAGQLSDEAAPLAGAAEGYRAVIAATSPGSRRGHWITGQLGAGKALRIHGRWTGDPGAVESAVGAYRAVLGEVTPGEPHIWIPAQLSLALSLSALGQLRQDVQVLGESAIAYALGLAQMHGSSPDERALVRVDMGDVLVVLADRSRDRQAAEAAITCYREALQVLDPGTYLQEAQRAQLHLGAALLVHGAISGDAGSLEQAVAVCRTYCAHPGEDISALELGRAQCQLGNAQRALAEARDDPVLAKDATRSYRAALKNIGSRHEHRIDEARVRVNLGNARRLQGDLLGSARHMRQAIRQYRLALAVLRPAGPAHEWAVARMNLATALLHLGELTRQVRTVQAAASSYRAALRQWPDARHASYRQICLMNLATALARIGESRAHAPTLERAAAAFREALTLTPQEVSPAERAKIQMNLGMTLRNLGELSGTVSLLEEAVAAGRQAAAGVDAGALPADWARAQMNLGITLLTLGELTRDPGPLHEAIAAGRLALSVRQRTRAWTGWARAAVNLSNTLQRLAGMTGSPVFAGEAVAVARRALTRLPARVPLRERRLAQVALATALGTLGSLREDRAPLQEAVDLLRAAVHDAGGALSAQEISTAWMNLGGALQTLGEMAADAGLIRQSLEADRLALAALPASDSTQRASLLSNQSVALRGIGALTHDPEVTREAVEAARSALALTRVERGPLLAARMRGSLGLALRQLCQLEDHAESWQALIDSDGRLLEDAAALAWSAASVGEQLLWCEYAASAAARLGEALSHVGRHQEALLAAQRGMALQLATGLRVREHDRPELVEVRNRWRASCALADRIDQALEQARSGTQLTRLQSRRQRVRQRLESAFAQMRALIEAQQLRPAPALSPAAIRGALPKGAAMVLIAPGATRTVMYIVPGGPDGTDLHTLSVPFSRSDLTVLLGSPRFVPGEPHDEDSWMAGYARFRHGLAADGIVARGNLARWNRCIERSLARLWDALMGPLDAFLRETVGLAPGADVVLVPAGALGLLPLHAAGHRREGMARCFLQSFTPSYAPSPQAWIASRRRSLEPQRMARRLVAVTLLAGANPAMEVAGFSEPIELALGEARRTRVLSALPVGNIISLYCHGLWNPGNPALSALLLHPEGADGPWQAGAARLTVRDLQGADLRCSRLALLWACESAMIGMRHASEAISFPGALLEAGVPGVVASLWAVEDNASRHLARGMLAALQRGVTPAAALREAQLAMLAGPDTGAEAAAEPVRVLSMRPDRALMERGETGAEPAGQVPQTAPYFWAGFTLTGV